MYCVIVVLATEVAAVTRGICKWYGTTLHLSLQAVTELHKGLLTGTVRGGFYQQVLTEAGSGPPPVQAAAT